MFLEMPVAFCMFVVGFVGLWIIQGKTQAFNVIGSDIWEQFSSYGMSVVPMFIFMGNIAFRTGVTNDLFNTAYKWVGQVRGGMGVTTVLASAAFGAICGSNAATCATMGTIALPIMKQVQVRRRAERGLRGGRRYAGRHDPAQRGADRHRHPVQPLHRQAVRGGDPGRPDAHRAVRHHHPADVLAAPQLGPAGPKTTFKEKMVALSGVIETLVLFVFVIGGMFAGWFTPTEGGAFGSAGAIIISLVRRHLTWARFKAAVWDTISTSVMVLLLVAGAVVLGRFLTAAYLPTDLADWVTGLNVARFWVLMVITVVYILGGMFTDALGFLTLSVPVFFPLAEALDYNIVWFAVYVTVLTTFGAISPPVGINLYIVKGLRPDMPIATIMQGGDVVRPLVRGHVGPSHRAARAHHGVAGPA